MSYFAAGYFPSGFFQAGYFPISAQSTSTNITGGTLTPSSTTSGYITNAEFVSRYDVNLVGQLLSDTTTRVQAADIPTNATLSTILQDASGMVETAALVGGRYESADLTTLVAQDTNGNVSNGGQYLKRLVADLAMGLLRQRRGMAEDQPFPPFISAMRQLELIRQGESIFPFAEVEQAGRAADTNIQPWQMERQGRISTVYRRFFGLRADQENRY